MIDKIKIAIVGCGKIGRTHANILTKLSESDFVAVCSRTQKNAEEFGRIYGVKAYTDVEKMIEESHVEAIIICTPHPIHAKAAVIAARAGVHVVIEKPLASSLEDCDIMISEAKKTKIKLGMISQRRLYPSVQRVKNAITHGKIGKPILGNVTMLGSRNREYYESDRWRGKWVEEGGGVLVNQAPHQIDLLQWFMGPVKEITGFWANFNHPYIEVEDTAVAVIRFENGSLGNLLLSNSQNPALYGKVSIFGMTGASIGVQTDGGAMFIAGMSGITEPPVNDLWTVNGEEGKLEEWKTEDIKFFEEIDGTEYFHMLQIKDFIEAVKNDRDPAITGEEGRKTVEIFTGLYRAQRDRKVIQFPLKPEYERSDFDGRLI
jgi:UDP-N-acetyl-2-amino-2-deoxyglucuronate dehydrogenase